MSDNNKQQNKLDEIKLKSVQPGASNLSILKDNEQSVYLYKKTEKLISALYLLTSFISDKEPAKWQLRETGLKLLSQGLPLSDKGIQGSSFANLILSLLETTYMGGIISEMNFNILKFEFENLRESIIYEEQERLKGAIYPSNFFKIAEALSGPSVGGTSSKGQSDMSDRHTSPLYEMSLKKPAESVRLNEQKLKDKTNRQGLIIDLLRQSPGLGIKDFSSSIKNCSEKTIQRELASLITKGQIKKEGEKRWSRYSLK